MSEDDGLARLEARMDAKLDGIRDQVRDALAAQVALREAERAVVEERIRGVEAIAKLTQDAATLAVTKAEAATERRFEGVNEFRSQLADQANTFLPRETYEQSVASWTLWRNAVDEDRAKIAGRSSGVAASVGWIVAAAGFVATILVIVTILANVLTK